MSSQYCRHCGQMIATGQAFCSQCGKPVQTSLNHQSVQQGSGSEPGMLPGSGQVTATQPYRQAPAQIPVVSQSPSYAVQPASQSVTAGATGASRRRVSWIPLLVGILLLIFGLRIPLLMVAGTRTTGHVVSVQQRINSSSDRMDYNYDIEYVFTAGNGNQRSGSYSMNKVYQVNRLPATGTSLAVIYLPFMPVINMPADRGNPVLSALIFTALGVLLVVVGLRGSKTAPRKRSA